MNAQFSYSLKVQEAQNTILDLDFEKYKTIRNTFSIDEKGLEHWLNSYKTFIEYKTTNKKLNSDSVLNVISENEDLLYKIGQKDAMYYYCLADINFMLCLFYFENNELLKSLSKYLAAKKQIENYQSSYPEFSFQGKHKLLMFTINNLISRQLSWGNEQSKSTYSDYLELYWQYSKTGNEVYMREIKLISIFLTNFQFNIEPKRVIQDFQITPEYSGIGGLETFASSVKYQKADDYILQLDILSNANDLGYFINLNVLNLQYGIALINQQNDSAIIFLQKYLSNQKTNKFRSYAQFKCSLYYFINRDLQKTDSLHELIQQSSNHASNEDIQAKYEVSHSHEWLYELVLARIFFDGGEFKKSAKVLLDSKDNISNYSSQQKLEYSYRLGRIYHKLNDLDKASRFYIMVIYSDLDSEYYYPAYSAYYLAEMYEEQCNFEKAKYFYALCIELDSPIYKASIHKKANQRLKK